MSGLKELRTRINSVKSTGKITKAMKSIAAAKLRVAQHNLTNFFNYASKLKDIMQNLMQADFDCLPDILREKKCKNLLIIFLTSDRGLCAGFNNNLIKKLGNFVEEITETGIKCHILPIGSKGHKYATKYFSSQVIEIENCGKFEGVSSSDITHKIISMFDSGKIDSCCSIYSQFCSAIKSDIIFDYIFPMNHNATLAEPERAGCPDTSATFGYEPSVQKLFETATPLYIESKILTAINHSATSEHMARMSAMDNACKSSEDMIGALTLKYNRKRQSMITNELIEIISGAESM